MNRLKIRQIILEEIALFTESIEKLRFNGVETELIDALKNINSENPFAWFQILLNSHPDTAGKNLLINKGTVAKLNQQSLLQFLEQNIAKINYIKDWLSNTSVDIKQLVKNKETIDSLYEKSDRWHKSLKATGEAEMDGKKVVKRYNDGLVWVDLETNSCREESKAMGHCGTDEDATTLFSLRSIKGTKAEPHVTLAWNQNKQAVTQIKGKENKPPVPKYMPYVWDFLKFLKSKNPNLQFIWSYDYDLSLKDVGENLGVVKCSQLYARDIVWKTTLPEPTLYYEGEEQKELTEELLNSVDYDTRTSLINDKYDTNYQYVLEFKNGVAAAIINYPEATVINLKGEDVIDSVELTEEVLNSASYKGIASIINRKYNTNYKYVMFFEKGIAVAVISYPDESTVINLKGQDVIESIELTEEILNNDISNNRLRASLINRKYNTNYERVKEFSNGIATAITEDGKEVEINIKGDIVNTLNENTIRMWIRYMNYLIENR